jgi:preprotein translocase subunit SecE
MGRPTPKPASDQDEDLIGEDWKQGAEAEETERSAGPVVSDSRRRRMLKRGETIEEPVKTKAAEPVAKDRTAAAPAREVELPSEGNFITRSFTRLVHYFEDVIAELRKVTWPTREQAQRLTYIVLAVTAVTAIILGLVSYLFGLLTAQVAAAESATIAGIIAVVAIVVVAVAWLAQERLTGGRRPE